MITFCNSCVIMLIMTILILTIGIQQLCVWLMMMTITTLTISFTTVVCAQRVWLRQKSTSHQWLPLHHTLPLNHDDTMFIIKIITVIIIFKITNDNIEQPFDNDKVVTNQNLSSINIKVQRIFKLRWISVQQLKFETFLFEKFETYLCALKFETYLLAQKFETYLLAQKSDIFSKWKQRLHGKHW